MEYGVPVLIGLRATYQTDLCYSNAEPHQVLVKYDLVHLMLNTAPRKGVESGL